MAPPGTCDQPLAISDEAELTDCINWSNGHAGADTLGLDANIDLTAALPNITTEITLNGNGFTVDGDNMYRVFYVAAASTTTPALWR
ncbi:MAG: hypothetical protein GY847_19005 [Proteobacteria bacterium]|nr:hypothetical protein [Pseudomonadota bacterium]